MAKKTTKRGNKNKGGLKIDLSNVETSVTIPEGNYIVEVEDVEVKVSENSGSNYLSFTFVIAEGKMKGQKLYHICSLQPQALFNLKGVLVALGFDIPDEEFELDTEALVGLQCGVEVSHEIYEGKKKSRITDFINLDEADSDDDEDEDDDSDDDEEDDEDDESEVDLEELDKDELKELAKALKIPAKKIKKAKTEEDLIDLIEEEADEEEIAEQYNDLFGDSDEDDEEDEDEEEDEEENDYESMTLKELKAEAKDRGLKVKKGMSKDDIIEMLEEDDEE